MDRLLKYMSFGLSGIITVCLAAATVVEKYSGAGEASRLIYGSPWMIALWSVMTLCALAYLLRERTRLSLPGLTLHLSFGVILAGACVTHFCGENGILRLMEGGEPATAFYTEDGVACSLPFAVTLTRCGVECYPGTSSPMDYYSEVKLGEESVRVSMNNVAEREGYRFYQTSLGPDYTILTVSHDPWGTGVSYAGYALLLLSMVSFFFVKRSRFRVLLRASVCAVLLMWGGERVAAEETQAPATLQKPLAARFGKLYVNWNGRVAPVQTMAREFCLKVYGNDSYRGLSAEQVLTGWLFYYDDWKHEPMVKVKSREVRDFLGLEGKYASLSEFYDRGGYRLADELRRHAGEREWMSVDEKVNLISQVCTGSGLKILPCPDGEGVEWYSWVERLPEGMDRGLAGSMEIVAREIAHGRYRSAGEKLEELRRLQEENAGTGNLPSVTRTGAERIYNMIVMPLACAVASILAGGCAFVLFCMGRTRGVWWRCVWLCGFVLWLYLTLVLALRWIAGGHLPVSNGYETMQAMAWLSMSLALLFSRRLAVMLAAGMLTGGFALLVSMMGQNNPAVTNLMPVLSSPLLSLHVMVIMTAYALFAIMMLDSVAAFAMRKNREMVRRLGDISAMLLYPAVFLLATGIFIGAVWANQSWGRYWGWDPKETWALITLLVYAWPLHGMSFPMFGRPKVRHIYFFAAFVTVLFTYFGVNYLLSGLHSYA